ncbi:unnamed protein product [Fraxinus pennsylvanica]|uniref:Uncharacterized protein n=1 Tax=Fraxinus pennsylvanica TaxID=56036 RepID=A0AAD2DVD3_9LAMI|nr:unnamed protein product [Fraxinus pennsylvanica]
MVCYLIVNRLPEGKTKEGERIANSFLSLSQICRISGHCGKLVPSWNRCLWWERFGLRIDCRYITACLGAVVCLGCQTNHKLTSSLEKPLKGKNPHSSKAAGTSEDFLTTSTYEMEDNTVESRGSISPISKLTQMHDAPGAGYSSNPSDFINHGKSIVNVFIVVLQFK